MADRERERLDPVPPATEAEAAGTDPDQVPAELNPYLRNNQGTPEPGPP